MSVNSNYQWYNCLNGCTRHPIRFRFELELRLPLWQKDAPSSKCSYSWHTLNLVWFLALPGSERDRMGDSPGRQAVRQPDKLEASSADMSFITKGTCDLTRCKLEPTKGKIKWKTYIVKINYWQAAVSCSGARRRSYSRNRRNDAAQTTKTMAKETQRRQRANASCQSW